MAYIQRRFYLPEQLYSKLILFAKSQNTTVNEVLRTILKEGLEKEHTHSQVGEKLLRLAEIAGKESIKAPKDISENHDKYFVEISQ